MTQEKENYFVYGKVYNVQERQKENFGESLTNDEKWYEYDVYLQNSNGEIVDFWDSLTETYNGVKGQRLTEKQAKNAIEEIKTDIEENNEDPSYWFDIE